MSFVPSLSRPKGPPKRHGPPGVLRASYARCGWCQRVDARPLERRDLRRWTRHPELGHVHRWCLKVARRKWQRVEAKSSRPRPARSLSDDRAPKGMPPGARAGAYYRDGPQAGAAIPVWVLEAHPVHALVRIIGRRTVEGGRTHDPRLAATWVPACRVSVWSSPPRPVVRGGAPARLSELVARLT